MKEVDDDSRREWPRVAEEGLTLLLNAGEDNRPVAGSGRFALIVAMVTSSWSISTPPVGAEELRPLTLEDCLVQARERSFALKEVDQEIVAARGVRSQARSGLLPKVYAQGQYSFRERAPIGSASTGTGGATLDQFLTVLEPQLYEAGIDRTSLLRDLTGGTRSSASPSLTSRDYFELGLNLHVPVIDLSSYFKYRSSDARLRSLTERREMEWNRLRGEIKRLFFAVLFAREVVGIAEEAESISRQNYDMTERLFESGKASHLDAARAKVEWGNARTQALQARDQVLIARETLHVALSSPPHVRPDVSGTFGESFTLPGESAVLRAAEEHRPELRVVSEGYASALGAYRSARSMYLPTLSAEAGYSAQNDTLFEGPDNYFKTFRAGATLQIPLLDGGLVAGRVSEARAEVGRVENERRRLLDQIRLEVRRAYLLMKGASERVEGTGSNLDAAQENLRVGQERYSRGLISFLELQNIQLAFVGTRTQHVQALFDRAVASADLEQAMNLPSEDWPK